MMPHYPGPSDYQADPRDLEVLVVLIELAAIDRTPTPDTTFTFEEMFQTMLDYGGREIGIRESDVRIVMGMGHPFLRRHKGGRFSLK